MSLIQIAVVGGMAAIAYLAMSGNGDNGGFGGGLGTGGVDEEEKKEPSEPEEMPGETVFITTEEQAAQVSGKKEVTASEALWESLFGTKDEYGEPTPGYAATGEYIRPSGEWTMWGPTHKESPYYGIPAVKKLTSPISLREGGLKLSAPTKIAGYVTPPGTSKITIRRPQW